MSEQPVDDCIHWLSPVFVNLQVLLLEARGVGLIERNVVVENGGGLDKDTVFILLQCQRLRKGLEM